MLEAGLMRDAEGLFASRTGERFRPDSWITAGSENERSAAIVAETWRRAGIDSQTYVVPVAATRDPEVRAAFPGLATVGIGASEDSIKNFTSAEIGTAANRWRGGNRGGWASPEVDRLVEAFNSTLDRAERDRQAINIARVISEELPILAYHPNFRAIAHVSALRGPTGGSVAGLSQWNIHEWYWAQ
jgi:ABC-type transport system substrate-binding protein